MPPKRSIDNGSNSQMSAEPVKRQKTEEYEQSSDEKRDELREWLDRREHDPKLTSVFSADSFPIPKSRKGKRKPYAGLTEQLSLGGQDHMEVAYSVCPAKQWKQLLSYHKFTLPNGEKHGKGSCVFVKHGDSGEKFVDIDKQWKAQVLEIRALDENHVYLRVTWLEIPRDLPGGERPYHASNELVVSNEMSIIDAQTVNGGLDVVYWDETNDELSPPDPDSYFWRQQYDKHNNILTKLRKICKCESPHNPSDLIVRCSNCTAWLHTTCIVESAQARHTNTKDTSQTNGVKDTNPARRRSRKQKTSIQTSEKQEGNQPMMHVSMAEGGKPLLVIEEVGKIHEEEVRCLICEQIME